LNQAIISGADFGPGILDGSVIGTGISKEQLYSTASYRAKNLRGVGLSYHDLTSANLGGQNLTNASLFGSTLTGADLSGAKVTGASFSRSSRRDGTGITQTQLRSTSSYEEKNLRGIVLGYHDLRGLDLSDQNLADASFHGAALTGTDFTNAIVTGANFSQNDAYGSCDGDRNVISQEQLYSTPSYLEGNLRGMAFDCNDLSGWQLSNQDLSGVRFDSANVSGADLSGAKVTGAEFSSTEGLTSEQLYSTASYQQKNLTGIVLDFIELEGWDLRGQDLANARLQGSNLSGTDLSDSNLTGADLSGAELGTSNLSRANLTRAEFGSSQLAGADLSDANIRWAGFYNNGLTKEQLYSTASYQEKDLLGIILLGMPGLLQEFDFSGQDLRWAVLAIPQDLPQDLSRANFRDADLALAKLSRATLAEADLRGANLANASLSDADLQSTRFDSSTTYTARTRWPEGFDPGKAGLTLLSPAPGDVDANGILDAADLQFLQDYTALSVSVYRFNGMGVGGHRYDYEIISLFDLNNDGRVDSEDHRVWVKDLKQTYYGDANLDGEFNSGDLVQVFAAGEYEDEARVNSTWATGDWNSDWEFNTSDMVFAFQDNGYERGVRAGIVAVPEPSYGVFMIACVALMGRRRVMDIARFSRRPGLSRRGQKTLNHASECV
jgi:uncharacterized protein YjbI with pentapeptide repeats